MTSATLDYVDTRSTADQTSEHEAADHQTADRAEAEAIGPQSIGHYMAMVVPTCMLLLFAVVTVGIQTQTNNWLHAIEFGVYASVWIGGGFGFMIAGIMWGIDQVEHDHGD